MEEIDIERLRILTIMNSTTIFYDCGENVPVVYLKFSGYGGFHIANHSTVDLEIEPDRYRLFAGYQLSDGMNARDFIEEMDVTIEPGCNYTVKVNPDSKTVTFTKRMDGFQRCC